MNTTRLLFSAAIITTAFLVSCQTVPTLDNSARNAFANRRGAFILIDCSSGTITDIDRAASSEKLPPCSTFKIWNTLIGLESGIISTPGEAFYKWDGETRIIPQWNMDLTLKQAFRASCVPAFQKLARDIGPKRMQLWIDRVGYGDRNVSAGADVFWLPAPGRKTLLITPREQAALMCKLVSGALPFSKTSQAVLKNIMTAKKTDKGVLYGKTGTSVDDTGKYVMGWFVGYVESDGKTHAFACTVKGDNAMGKDARAVVETALEKEGLL